MRRFSARAGVLVLAAALMTTLSEPAHADVPGITQPTAPMPSGRDAPSVVELQDGRALVVGGERTTDGTDQSEIYNPQTSSWTLSPPAATAVVAASATRLGDGRVLVAGGYVGGYPTDAALLYDPVANTWIATGQMHRSHAGQGAALLGDGAVLVAGQWSNVPAQGTEVYIPSAGTWSVVPDPPITGDRLVALHDGNAMLIGQGAAIFNYTTRTWHTVATEPSPRFDSSAVVLADGDVLLAGGDTSTNYPHDAEIYDPASDTWRYAGDIPYTALQATGVLLPDGRVVLTGFAYPNAAQIVLFDPATDLWRTGGQLLVPHTRAAVSLLGTGSVLVAGGYNSPSDDTSSELYIPPPAAPAAGSESSTPPAELLTTTARAPYANEPAVLVGRLLDANHNPLPGQTVNLYRQDPADTGWTHVTQATTDAAGRVVFVESQSSTTTWAMRHPASQTAGQAAGRELVVAVSADQKPGPPAGVGAQPEDGAAFVTWNAPDDDGDQPVTGYRVADASGLHDVGPNVRSYESTGLTNGHTYWITVQAMNAVGPGPTAGAEVTPEPGAQRQDDGNLCGVIASGSTTTLTAVGSPYRICHAGVTVAPGGTLVLDVTAGPIQLTASGANGVTVDQADLRTVTGGTSNRISYSGASSQGSSWTSIRSVPVPIAPVCPSCTPSAHSASWIDLTQMDLHGGEVDAHYASGVHLSGSTVDAAPPMETNGTALQLADVSITNPLGYGIDSECDGDCALSLTNVTVDNAPSTGVRLLGSSDLTIHGLTVTRSGTSSHSPAVELLDTTTTFGSGQRVDGVVGASNAIDAIGLDNVFSQADLTWISPASGSQLHPLGYVVESGLTMQSHTTMTVPAGGVVKVATGGGLTLDGASLDASAGGAALTSASDNSVGPSMCPSVLAPSCTVTANSWRGIRMLSANVNLVGARVTGSGLGDQSGTEIDNSNVVVKDSTIEDCNIAVHSTDTDYPPAPPTKSVEVSGSTIRDCSAGIVLNGVHGVSLTGDTLAGAHRVAESIGGIDVGATAQTSVVIDDDVVSGFDGYGLFLQGGSHPEVRDDVLRDNGYAAYLLATMSVGPGLDISGLTGQGNGVNALQLQGQVTQDMTWVSPGTSTTDAPLGYFIGTCGVEFTSGASLVLPADAVVSAVPPDECAQPYALTFDGGRLDGSAGGAFFASVTDTPGESSWKNVVPPNSDWNAIDLRPDSTGKATASLSLDRARIVGASTAILANGSVSVTNSNVHGLVSVWTGAATLTNDTFDDADVGIFGQPTTVTNDVFTASTDYGPALAVGPSTTPSPGTSLDPITVQHVLVNDARGPNPYTGDRVPSVVFSGFTTTFGTGQQIDDLTTTGGQNVAYLSNVRVAGDLTWITPQPGSQLQPLGYIGGQLTMQGPHVLTLPRDAIAKISHLTLDGAALDGRAGGALITGAGDDTVSPALSPPDGASDSATAGISTMQRTDATGGSVALYGDRVNASISATAVGSAPGSPTYTIAVDHSVVDAIAATNGAAVSVTSSDIRTASVDDGLSVDRASSPSTITNDRVSGPGSPKIGVSDSQVDVEQVTATGSAAGIGVQLAGATTGTFSCLDISGNADGVKTVASVYGPAPAPTITTSDLTGNTGTGGYDVDNAAAVATSDVWWGQAGGPQPGQVRNPALLTDQNPRTTAADCGGRPTTPPAAPTNVTAQGGASSALVSWTAPTDDGGTPISGWTVTAYPGGATTSAPAGASSLRVTGLASGTTYTFAVVGTNAVTDSPPGIARTTVTPTGGPEVSNVSAPTLITANPDAVPVSGTAGPAAANVELTASDGQNVVSQTVAVAANDAFSANLNLTGLRDGNVVLDVVAKAADGTPGPIVSRNLTKDTEGPAVRVTSMRNPLMLHARVVGKTEPNSRVRVVITDRLGHMAVASTVADRYGAFAAWPWTAMLAAGTARVEVQATDPYGHVGSPVWLSRTMPPPPTPTGVSVAGPSRSFPHSATISGSAPAQSLVTIVFMQGGKHVSTRLTVASGGTFSTRVSLAGFATGWVTVDVTAAWALGAPQSTPVVRRFWY